MQPLAPLRSKLRGPRVDPTVADALARFLVEAPEPDVVRFNAWHVAHRLAVSRRDLLTALARGVEQGLVTLDWELYCLACKAQNRAFGSLRDARSRQTCKSCHATYDAPLDVELMVTFSVAPQLRQVTARRTAEHDAIDERYGRVTAHAVMTVQAFRDLFVQEPLPRNEALRVEKAAILFTDLGGSTALYARRGDPRAYTLVREHFDRLERAVDLAGGAIVKTIGDAVMAAFPAAPEAVSASFGALDAIDALNAEADLAGPDALQLKLGLHAGPCLVVTLNDRLDYFGTTVNVAARVQRRAGPGQVLFTGTVRDDLPEGALAGRVLRDERMVFKGLEDREFDVCIATR